MRRPEVLNVGEQFIPYEEASDEPGLLGAAKASNATYAGEVILPDGSLDIIEVFDEGRTKDGHLLFSFRGPFVPYTTLASLYPTIPSNPTLPGLEHDSADDLDDAYTRYLIGTAIGAQSLRSSDYWLED